MWSSFGFSLNNYKQGGIPSNKRRTHTKPHKPNGWLVCVYKRHLPQAAVLRVASSEVFGEELAFGADHGVGDSGRWPLPETCRCTQPASGCRTQLWHFSAVSPSWYFGAGVPQSASPLFAGKNNKQRPNCAQPEAVSTCTTSLGSAAESREPLVKSQDEHSWLPTMVVSGVD